MVKKLLQLFHQELGGLHRAAIVLAASSSVSAILGFVRDRLLAGTFGAGQSLDIYYTAFKIPDLLYAVSLSLVSVTVLIPFFLEKISVSPEKGRDFLNNIFSAFLLAMLFLIAVVFFAIPYLSDVIAPGFSDEARQQLIVLTRVLLLSPFLLGLANLLSSVVQSFNRFFVYALSAVFYNVGIIFGILFFLPKIGLLGITLGVILGAVMQVCVQMPSIVKLGFIPKFKLRMNFLEIWQTIKLSLPRTLGLSLNQIVFIFITATASFLASGSIAVFNLSFNLQSVPLTVVGVSYSVAAFPTLARLFVANQKEKFLNQTIIAMRQIIFWSIPVSILLIVLRAQIVRVIFGYGQFDWRDTRLTAASLALFAFSITSQALVVLFVRAFYAAGKTMKPVIVNVISSGFIVLGIFISMKLINVFSSFKNFLETGLRVKDMAGSEMLILPLIFSLGMIFNAAFLVKIFQKEFGEIWSSVKWTLFQVMAASILMGVVTYFSLSVLDKIFNIKTFAGIFFQGLVSGIFGLGVWYLALCSAKNKELREITASLKQRFWKTPIIASEPEELP
ncbi:MAG: hypothetical protein HY773_01845 [Candidatus Terrybacteria bacterium]|nr:hypothetical protein [Candidatus Terrybacteria bacterium]